MMENFECILQLFAEAAEGDTTHFTGETEAAAAPQATGDEAASAAGVQDRSSAFEKLIKGEKEKATHSSVLAWEIPWTEEPDGLQSMGSKKSQ